MIINQTFDEKTDALLGVGKIQALKFICSKRNYNKFCESIFLRQESDILPNLIRKKCLAKNYYERVEQYIAVQSRIPQPWLGARLAS